METHAQGVFVALVHSGMLDGCAVPKWRVKASGSFAEEAVLIPAFLRTRFLKNNVL